jgi:hypothetical protein
VQRSGHSSSTLLLRSLASTASCVQTRYHGSTCPPTIFSSTAHYIMLVFRPKQRRTWRLSSPSTELLGVVSDHGSQRMTSGWCLFCGQLLALPSLLQLLSCRPFGVGGCANLSTPQFRISTRPSPGCQTRPAETFSTTFLVVLMRWPEVLLIPGAPLRAVFLAK